MYLINGSLTNAADCNFAINFDHTPGGESWANDITKDASGNTYLTGALIREIASCFIGGDEEETAFILKFQNDLPTWGVDFPVPYTAGGRSEGKGIAINSSGDVLFTGWFKGDINCNIGASSIPVFYNSSANKNLFYGKLNNSLTLMNWAHAGEGGLGDAEGSSIVSLNNDKALLTGYFNDSIDFYSNSSWGMMYGVDNKDVVVAQLDDATGLVTEVALCAGSSDETGTDVAKDGLGNAYVVGNFTGSMNMYHYNSTLAYSLYTGASSSAFLRKHCNAAGNLAKTGEITGTHPVNLESEILIYPNPTRDKFVIDCKQDFIYELYDITGRVLVKGEKGRNNLVNLDVRNVASGVLLLKIVTDSNVYMQQIVKQ
jgi:hypothetical protein